VFFVKKTRLQEKVGKLLVIGFPGKSVTAEVKELIHDYHVGSIILFSRNIGTPEEVVHLTTALQKEAKAAGHEQPLLIGIDQENGVVRRLGKGATIFPGAMALGATNHPDYAYDISLATGKELKALGINWNFAPVLDVNNNPNNPVIGVRSFGEDPAQVASFGCASMKGMQDAGVMTAVKHFPGHGDTHVDSHIDLPVIDHRLTRLEEVELIPFKACIEKGADAVMAAHIHFPAIDTAESVPATLSKKMITDLLRHQLAFTGMIITDCLEMDAIVNTIGTEKGAVESLKAGVDLTMISHTYERQIGAIQAIMNAFENGELYLADLEASIQRISIYKERYVWWEDALKDNAKESLAIVGSEKHEKLAWETYVAGVTIVENDGILPLQVNPSSRILVLEPVHELVTKAEDKDVDSFSLGDAVRFYHETADSEPLPHPGIENQADELIEKAKKYDYVILGTQTLLPDHPHIALVNKLVETGVQLIGVGMRNPYDSLYIKGVNAFIHTYEPNAPALKVAAGAIFGEVIVNGQLPVRLTRN